MEKIQDHRLLATVVVILIGVAVGIFLFVLGRSAGPPPATITARTTQTDQSQSSQSEIPAIYGSGENKDIQQVNMLDLLAREQVTARMIENVLYADINDDGAQEALVMVRREGDTRPLDVFIYAMEEGSARKVFERTNVAQGAAAFDGPQLVITEDAGCCPPKITRTYYTWQNGGMSLLKTIVAPAGAPGP